MSAAPALTHPAQYRRAQDADWLQPIVDKGNWAVTPNTLWNDLAPLCNGSFVQIVSIGQIWTRTAGATPRRGESKPEWVVIKMEEFARAAGKKNPDGTIEPASIRACEIELQDAFDRKLIDRTRVGNGYSYKALPENWSTAPPKPRVVQPPKSEVVENTESDTTTTRTVFRVVDSIVCLPGERSKPILLETAVREKLHGIQFEALSGEVDFASEVNEGILQIRASVREGVGQPRDTIRPAVSPPRPLQNGHHKDATTRTTVRVASERFADNKGLSNFLNPIFRELFGKPPDPRFLARIVEALGAATLEDYQYRVKMRLKSPSGSVESGLFLLLAQDVAADVAAADKERVELAAEEAKAEARFHDSQRPERIHDLLSAIRAGTPIDELRDFYDPGELAEARRLAEVQ